MHYLYFDTVRLNPNTGGVLNVSALLLRQLREELPNDIVSVSERFPRLYRLFERMGISRFILDTLIYNYVMFMGGDKANKTIALFPNYFLPFTPFGRHANAIVIIHDLQFKVYPENFGLRRVSWLNWSLKRVVRSKAHVVFISNSSQNDFHHYYGITEKETVILNPVETGLPSLGRSTIGNKRYLIAAYHYYPHKNFRGVLDLFAQLRAAGIVDLLYVTGNGSGKVADVIQKTHADLQDSIVMLGFVAQDKLAELYIGACAFVSMSHFEGFNLSAAEAATLKVPLLLSNIPAHKELFGGYAMLLDNGKVDADKFRIYLQKHLNTRPIWRNSSTCEPHNVAHRYITLHKNLEPSV